MIIRNKWYCLSINDTNGSVESFNNGHKEFIFKGGEEQPLFTIRFRDKNGDPVDFHSFHASSICLKPEVKGEMTKIELLFMNLKGLDIHAQVSITCYDEDPLSYWNISIEHDTEYYIEWIDFPCVVIPNDLIGEGGEARILWPAVEGVLIEDIAVRENSGFKYEPVGYPGNGVEGLYPAACFTQFMAYYDEQGGIYLGAHDEKFNVKTVEFYRYSGGIRLEYKLFPGGVYKDSYKMEYPMVLGVFSGDWHDAAQIYRTWLDKCNLPEVPKLVDNKNIPGWMRESPVVVAYPVRGKKDTGNMDPNKEYFPYTNAIPYIDEISEELNSNILVLLMHWEGTAPWAPPYMWPPFGGEENFTEFADRLHEKGNLAGVYCSGIAWTQESLIIEGYKCNDVFEKNNLHEVMCVSPKGELQYSKICNGNGAQRWGYDMCPVNKFVKDVSAEQISGIARCGYDYIQFFDQHTGGTAYACYSKKHGHPPAPGKWRNQAMIELMKELQRTVDRYGKKVAIGCEFAAAEPFIPYLPFNELRYGVAFHFGRPIPLYQYIYHEYINSFMGNQVLSSAVIDTEKSPDSIMMRIAMSFTNGEMFTLVLKDGTKVKWDWGPSKDYPEPDQIKVKKMVKDFNTWRKNAAKPFLCFGRMEKPYALQGVEEVSLELLSGGAVAYPAVFTTRWVSKDGRNAQIFANHTGKTQNVGINLDNSDVRRIKIYKNPGNEAEHSICSAMSILKFEIRPYSALMIEFV